MFDRELFWSPSSHLGTRTNDVTKRELGHEVETRNSITRNSEPATPMPLNATQSSVHDPPRGAAMKFTYPSGSRPLDGFTIKRGVGRGGFGEVYFGESDGGKEVALKLIRRNLEVELRGVRECLNLKHPHLVGLYDIKTDDMDDRWVVMEYVSGESLEDQIDRHPEGMPRDEVLRWMHGLAAGVAYLHDHGIVHRDLKPGNIFNDEGVVKIGDYGLAKFISCSRRSGQTESIGTIHYMAPEIANGRYGREIDIYALGVILYEMLTGHVPFEGESVGEVLMKHLTAEPDLSRLDEPYRTIVARALHKDPEQRLRSVNEMIALLPDPPAGASASGTKSFQAASAGSEEKATDELAAEPEFVRAVPVDEDEEPIARTVRDIWASTRQWWDGLQIKAGAKTVLLVLIILGLIVTSEEWISMLLICSVFYGIYWVIRAIVKSVAQSRHHHGAGHRHHVDRHTVKVSPTPVASDRVFDQRDSQHAQAAGVRRGSPFAPGSEPARMQRRHSWRHEYCRSLVNKSGRQRVVELCGSMLFAAMVAATLSIVAGIIVAAMIGTSLHTEQVVWLALVGTLGSWAVMLPAKTWEGKTGDDGARRFAMLMSGLVLGALAYGLAATLFVDLPSASGMFGGGLLSGRLSASHGSFSSYPLLADAVAAEAHVEALHNGFHTADGTPTLASYLVYFGLLFVVLRWWRQADPVRTSRLSLWATAWCIAWAWLLTLLWWFPQPWGLTLAGIIAMSTQLASPWVSPEDRVPRPQESFGQDE